MLSSHRLYVMSLLIRLSSRQNSDSQLSLCLNNILVGCFVVFNATFNNISVISWRSVLLMDETAESGDNHRPVVSHWQTLVHNVVLPDIIQRTSGLSPNAMLCWDRYYNVNCYLSPCYASWSRLITIWIS